MAFSSTRALTTVWSFMFKRCSTTPSTLATQPNTSVHHRSISSRREQQADEAWRGGRQKGHINKAIMCYKKEEQSNAFSKAHRVMLQYTIHPDPFILNVCYQQLHSATYASLHTCLSIHSQITSLVIKKRISWDAAVRALRQEGTRAPVPQKT
jgi:hypothetical protein